MFNYIRYESQIITHRAASHKESADVYIQNLIFIVSQMIQDCYYFAWRLSTKLFLRLNRYLSTHTSILTDTDGGLLSGGGGGRGGEWR